MRRPHLATLLVVPTLLLAGCGAEDDAGPQAGKTPSSSPTSSPSGSPSSTPSSRPKVIGTVARGLEVPWGIAFLPDGTALVTERDSGRVFRVGRGEVTQVGRVEESRAGGEDRKSTRLNSSHSDRSRMPSSA